MKLTMPISILISSFLIASALVFRADNLSFISAAEAEVAGMDYWDLRSDRDFKKAVEYVVENFRPVRPVFHFEEMIKSTVEECNVRGDVWGTTFNTLQLTSTHIDC